MPMRNIALWVVIAALLIALFSFMQPGSDAARANEISYSQMLEKAKSGEVRSIEISGNEIDGTYTTGENSPQQCISMISRLFHA